MKVYHKLSATEGKLHTRIVITEHELEQLLDGKVITIQESSINTLSLVVLNLKMPRPLKVKEVSNGKGL